MFFSDEGERYDSDGEANDTVNKGNVYKDNCDTLSMDSSKQKLDLKNNINSNSPSPSKEKYKKRGTGRKEEEGAVDLGVPIRRTRTECIYSPASLYSDISPTEQMTRCRRTGG